MRNSWQRKGRLAVQTIVVGIAAVIGGAATIPTLVKVNEPSAATSDARRDMAMLANDEQPSSQRSLEPSAAEPSDSAGMSEPSAAPLAAAIASEPVASEPVAIEPVASEPFASEPFAIEPVAIEPVAIEPVASEPFASEPVASEPVASEPRLTSRPTHGIQHVRVFYATDRHRWEASNPHLWITAVVPGLLSILITCVLIAGCFAGKRRWAWALATSVGLVLSFILVGQSIIKSGQLVRLANEKSVWFAGGRFDSGGNYPLHLGISDVSLPPDHRDGQVERPSIFSFEFEEHEDRHVMVQRIESLESQAFFQKLSDRVTAAPDRSALVYIHGFNVEFDEALRRTAQIAKDIDFSGAPILYSWPSNGRLVMYHRDESDVEWSVAHLERFLADVHQRTGVKQLHVIAHSMGNRALVGALQLLALRYPDQQPMLGQVVLAAPDLDADEFRDRYAEAVKTCSKRATLYASSTDRALLASVQLHGHRRLGLTGTPQPTVAGVDLVDVTPVDTSLLGHSYYGSHPLMIRELMSLVHQGSAPEQRQWLTTLQTSQMPPLWRFIPELAAQSGLSTIRQ